MWLYFDPCGPFGLFPPDSRLSSLLWQSVQKIWDPIVLPCALPVRFHMLVNSVGCGNAEPLLGYITGCVDVELAANCGIRFSASAAATARKGKYPKTEFAAFPLLLPWQRRQYSY